MRGTVNLILSALRSMTATLVSSFPSVRYTSATVALSTFSQVTLTVSPVLTVSISTAVHLGNPWNAESNAAEITNKAINHIFIGASSGVDYTPYACAANAWRVD